MIDYEKIGKRILEQRKYLRRISQEKMAEELGMYQADISNLEKAKNGSGITDLSKLDIIADYFDMPLETLLFGRRQDQMEKYYGSKMQLKEYTGKRSKRHNSILRKLMSIENDEDVDEKLAQIDCLECGPYRVYIATETQTQMGEKSFDEDPLNSLIKLHYYVVYQDEVIGSMIADLTSVFQHVYQPFLQKLKLFIWPDVFDLDDTLEVLNPYLLLLQYSLTDEERNKFEEKCLQRTEQLLKAGEDRLIFYIEAAYVREDCRRNGIFRMMLDALKGISSSALIWLCLEPTSGVELDSGYAYLPTYEASELGQINLNASMAEHLGFTIDHKTVDRQA